MKVKRILSAAIIFFMFSLCGCSGKNIVIKQSNNTPEEVYKYSYNLLEEDEMPIMIFCGPCSEYVFNGVKYPSTITDKVFSDLKECGVNTILGIGNPALNDMTDMSETLRLSDKYGINYVVFDPLLVSVTDNGTTVGNPEDSLIRERIEYYKSCKSFAGLFLTDEPSVRRYEGISIAEKYVRKTFGNDKISYVNMLPLDDNFVLYSGDKEVFVSYEELLDRFFKETQPKYLSYDRYPFHTSNPEGKVTSDWFTNLAIIRYYAQKNKVPFMGHVQVGGLWEGIGNRLPDEREFMWNINTMLAYGCKGLSYFTGVQSTYHMDNPFGNEGLIAVDGEKTRYWYYSKSLYKHISAVDGILMNSANMGIIATGTTPDAISDSFNGKKIIDVYSSFREVKGVSSESALVGCFDYKGRTALYVVNNSFIADGKTKISFDGNYNMDVIQQGIVRKVTGSAVTLDLCGGESALILLK